MIQDLKEIYKDLEKTFGTEAVDKIHSHIHSLTRRIEQLTISRDYWKESHKVRNDDAKDYAKTITKLQKELSQKTRKRSVKKKLNTGLGRSYGYDRPSDIKRRGNK